MHHRIVIETLLPLIGGGIFGAVVKLFSMGMQNRAEQHKQTMEAFKAQAGLVQSNNEVATSNSGFAFTRRIIALSITGIIVYVALIPGDPVNVMTTVTEGGSYLWGLIDTRETKEIWTELEGTVILPVVIPSFQAIVGAYFGASIASSK